MHQEPDWPDELGTPALRISFEDYSLHLIPCIYIWIRGQTVLYIGSSMRGTMRPMYNHEIVKPEPTDHILIWHPRVMNADELHVFEKELIKKLKPKINKVHNYDNTPIPKQCAYCQKTFFVKPRYFVERNYCNHRCRKFAWQNNLKTILADSYEVRKFFEYLEQNNR